MYLLSAASCHPVDGCLSPSVHRYLAWSFIVAFFSLVAVASWRRKSALGSGPETRQGPESKQAPRAGQGSEAGLDPEPPEVRAYAIAQSPAENVKAWMQMAIGVITVAVVGWRLLYIPHSDPETLILRGIGVGLAAAAALELAYTLFTPGPDEALDPLMLGLSATILFKLAAIDGPISLANAGAFLLLGVLLAVLFVTRLLLAERAAGERPNVWWIPYPRDRNTKAYEKKKSEPGR